VGLLLAADLTVPGSAVAALAALGRGSILRSDADTFWVFLVPQAVLIWVYWRYCKRRPGPALLPLRSLRHRSAGIDASLIVATVIMGGLLTRLVLINQVSARLDRRLPDFQLLSGVTADHHWLALVMGGIVVCVGVDLGDFLVHVMMHRVSWLWPFHAVHHEAPVLTPLSAARVHPVEQVIHTVLQSIVVGIAFSLWHCFGAQQTSTPSLLGTQVTVLVLAAVFGSARHSSVPVRFGPLERIFISPAMHQVHHSRHEQHHNRNFGESLAIWDWLYGSWHRRAPGEEVVYGVAGRSGVSLHGAYTEPFAQSFRCARKAVSTRLGRAALGGEPAQYVNDGVRAAAGVGDLHTAVGPELGEDDVGHGLGGAEVEA